ncbi:hypothetical protein WMY93_009994 [Mugilogobius chulae]|uniref:Uncharacterized protein n=1 Tax=Mugilogobius chulae TaxID=88201 RepID=A0AAW0P6I5_9GOBI
MELRSNIQLGRLYRLINQLLRRHPVSNHSSANHLEFSSPLQPIGASGLNSKEKPEFLSLPLDMLLELKLKM